MCVVLSSALPQAHVAFSRGPWTVVTFRHLFVKVNNAYERFIAMFPPPFAASNNFCWEVYGLHT